MSKTCRNGAFSQKCNSITAVKSKELSCPIIPTKIHFEMSGTLAAADYSPAYLPESLLYKKSLSFSIAVLYVALVI
jgi:hypothetical protein